MSQRARLRWRCRRGMLELDLLLQGFIAQGFDALSPASQADFSRLLDLPDQELLELLLGRHEPMEGEWRDVIEAIRRAAAP